MLTGRNGAAIAAAWHVPDASHAVTWLLHGLQHRGSDGAGIASANGESVFLFRHAGMLSETMSESRLAALPGDLAIGQVRMASADDHGADSLQPVMVRAHQGSFAIASTGLLTNGITLRRRMEEDGLIFQGGSDAEIIAHLIQVSPGRMKEKIETACQMLKGAYTFLIVTKNTMYAVVSPDQVQTLYFARLGEGYVFASETSGFGMFEVEDVTAIAPGQMIILGKNGFEKRQMQLGKSHWCAMEPVYYAREDSQFSCQSIHKYRHRFGQLLAQNEPNEADIVIGVPDTASSAASAFARALDLPYEIGLIKNRYLGSTSLSSMARQREEGMRVRLNAISSIVRGKRIFLIDDSMQKGRTASNLCDMLHAAGAKEIHLRIAAPRITHSCLYGIEYIEPDDLCANHYDDAQLAELYGADSVRFLDLEAFESALPKGACRACMNGDYPIALHDFESLSNKEGIQ